MSNTEKIVEAVFANHALLKSTLSDAQYVEIKHPLDASFMFNVKVSLHEPDGFLVITLPSVEFRESQIVEFREMLEEVAFDSGRTLDFNDSGYGLSDEFLVSVRLFIEGLKGAQSSSVLEAKKFDDFWEAQLFSLAVLSHAWSLYLVRRQIFFKGADLGVRRAKCCLSCVT